MDILTILRSGEAIRTVDGRWTNEFVDLEKLHTLLKEGKITVETRNGLRFAVLADTDNPNA